MLATMMALVKKGDLVVSVVAPPDASHPSVKNAVLVAGGRFLEVKGADTFEQMLAESSERPKLVVATTISPSKRHLPEPDLVRVIDAAKRIGALAMLDDAHMSTRVAVYDERPGLALGADISVWSMDKHMTGPRAGMVAGNKDLVREIRAKAFVFGLEAQLGSIVATVNALNDFDRAPVKRSAALADKALNALQPLFKGRGYRAGPGFALSGEDLLEFAMLEAGTSTADRPDRSNRRGGHGATQGNRRRHDSNLRHAGLRVRLPHHDVSRRRAPRSARRSWKGRARRLLPSRGL